MIVFVHLLNDRSGSPQVLCNVISALSEGEDSSRLYIGSQGRGVLDGAGIPIRRYWYWRSPWKVVTLLTYLVSQVCLFARLMTDKTITRDAIVYVNTLLPFGAALYGRLTGRRVIYHLHEVSVSPTPLRWMLTGLAKLTASRLIYVSEFHRKCLPIGCVASETVHNALSESFLRKAMASSYHFRRDGKFNILMLASLRDYKGVQEFVSLARAMESSAGTCFDLVLNDDDEAIHRYFTDGPLPENLSVHSRTSDPSIFYAEASLVLNLSRPDLWQETFGLTLLEAMAFGVPVIAPPVGGPLEFIEDGREGYLIDCRNGEELAAKVEELASDDELCQRLSVAARERAAQFTPDAFASAIRAVLRPQKENE